MGKKEFIERYGVAAYEKKQQQNQDWYKAHQDWYKAHAEEARERNQLWRQNNPDKVKASRQEEGRKSGRYYDRHCKYRATGLPHERNLVRAKHGKRYRPYKKIIAPDSVLHHEWLPNTANYQGVALVEKDQHQHGFIDVIQILEGEITLLTEEEVRGVL